MWRKQVERQIVITFLGINVFYYNQKKSNSLNKKEFRSFLKNEECILEKQLKRILGVMVKYVSS